MLNSVTAMRLERHITRSLLYPTPSVATPRTLPLPQPWPMLKSRPFARWNIRQLHPDFRRSHDCTDRCNCHCSDVQAALRLLPGLSEVRVTGGTTAAATATSLTASLQRSRSQQRQRLHRCADNHLRCSSHRRNSGDRYRLPSPTES